MGGGRHACSRVGLLLVCNTVTRVSPYNVSFIASFSQRTSFSPRELGPNSVVLQRRLYRKARQKSGVGEEDLSSRTKVVYRGSQDKGRQDGTRRQDCS